LPALAIPGEYQQQTNKAKANTAHDYNVRSNEGRNSCAYGRERNHDKANTPGYGS
jgi:hypothetical protein